MGFKLLVIVCWCVMTAFSILISTILLLLLHTPLPSFSCVWILIYILLRYSSVLQFPIFCEIPLFLGSPLTSSLSRLRFGKSRPLISMTQYFTTMMTKICTFSSHLARAWCVYLILCLVLALISFYGTKIRSTRTSTRPSHLERCWWYPPPVYSWYYPW